MEAFLKELQEMSLEDLIALTEEEALTGTAELDLIYAELSKRAELDRLRETEGDDHAH